MIPGRGCYPLPGPPGTRQGGRYEVLSARGTRCREIATLSREALPLLAVTADPIGERRLLHRSRGDGEHAHHAIRIIGDQLVLVQRKEEFESDERDALVAVY